MYWLFALKKKKKTTLEMVNAIVLGSEATQA